MTEQRSTSWNDTARSCTRSWPGRRFRRAASTRLVALRKPNCACAQPDIGHGPRYLWTRSAAGRTVGQLASAELGEVRREIENSRQFVAVTEQIVQVNEAICEARRSRRVPR